MGNMLTPGTKVSILPTYCLKKRHGEKHTIEAVVQCAFGTMYKFVGQDWVIHPEHVAPITE